MNRNLSNKVAFGILIPFLLVIGLALLNRTTILDWWHFLRYEPDSQVRLLSDEADFSEAGERLFYRADPTLISQARIEKLCLGADNLGCLVTGPQIYILEYDPGEEDIFNQAIVTGAHEMLHMAYFRLSEEEKNELRSVIDLALSKLKNDTRIFSILDTTTTHEEYYDEAYALLGTEVERLPLELEAHYRQYFNDRDSVLEAFDKSKSLLR